MFLAWLLVTLLMAIATAFYVVSNGFNKVAVVLLLGGAILDAVLYLLMVGI